MFIAYHFEAAKIIKFKRKIKPLNVKFYVYTFPINSKMIKNTIEIRRFALCCAVSL